MISIDQSSFLLPTKNFRRLSVLLAIHHGKSPSQHRIARETNLSSAMVNSYIKELSSQRLITVSRKNKRDMNYQLTAKGRAAVMSLLVQYSAEVVQLFGQAKNELFAKFRDTFNGAQEHRVMLYGCAETGDLVYQVLQDLAQTTMAGVVDGDPAKQGTRFHGHEILAPEAIEALRPDWVIITSFAKQDEIYDDIRHLEAKGIRIQKLSTL